MRHPGFVPVHVSAGFPFLSPAVLSRILSKALEDIVSP